ncbi:MAG: hypothetical protein ACYTGR_15850 [Planctomycetota bacterium]|jgi:hypothetical protein
MVSAAPFNSAQLDVLLRRLLPDVQGEPGRWAARIDSDIEVYIVADEVGDRMRIMVPVARVDRSEVDLLWVLLLANYDRALDAKYAVYENLVWATWSRRLSWSDAVEVEAAITDVICLARNTGSTFATGDVVYRDEYPFITVTG